MNLPTRQPMKKVASRIATFSVLALTFACASHPPPKRQAVKVNPKAEQEYRSAEKLAKTGDAKKALPKLKHFTQANPESELTGEAYYLMGNMHMNSQQYAEALNDYTAVINLPVASPYEIDSTLKAARLQLRFGKIADATKTLERSSRWKNVTPQQTADLEQIRYEIAIAEKNPMRALESLVQISQIAPTQTERDKAKSLAQDSLDSRFTEDDLLKIGDDPRFGFVRANAKYRYALLMADKRQFPSARRYFAETIELAPGTELAERAQGILNQIDTRNRVEAHTIGVVLPLTGKQAGIGYKALRGIQLGLGIYGNHGRPSGFRLAIVDSEGNPDMARHAVERLVAEDNVIAIIGGLLSKTAGAEASKAQEFGVPTIMLSQKAGVTQAGDFIFRNALTSQMQVAYLVDTAMKKLGMKNFAMLFPNDAYGVEYANLFWEEVRSRGGDIRGAQPYDPAETDFRGYVQRLTGTFYLEDRADEYRIMAKAWMDKNPRRSGQHGAPAPEELLTPIVDFDAIFVPDSAKAVGQIAPMLAYNNVNGVKLLGTNLWNSPGLVTRGQKFVEGSIFVDSFLATDPAFTGSDFFTSYKTTFDEDPGLTEVQAYDSALILRQLIAGGDSTRLVLQSHMAKVENFPGAIGLLSVSGEREFRRPLAALTVKDGRIAQFDNPQR